jgi:ribosomal protein S26
MLKQGGQKRTVKRILKYLRCRTCGVYIPGNKVLEKGYCSVTCAQQYLRCENCGRYFIPQENMIRNKNGNSVYCSEACSEIYRFSKITRSLK